MIDLKELRRRANDEFGLSGGEVEELLDALEDAQKDAARYREVRTGRYFAIIDGCGDEVRNAAADEAIDVFVAATQGEQ